MAANSKDHNVDLHKASNAMNVKKRRIYDVTNVLEGIGMFKKTEKNKVGWILNGNIQDLRLMHDNDRQQATSDFMSYDRLFMG